ncbi:TPA: hypothetical protein ACWZZU_001070 [Streptococcus agalactiae]
METLEMVLLDQLTLLNENNELIFNKDKLLLSRQAIIAEVEKDYNILIENEIDLSKNYGKAIHLLKELTNEAYQLLIDRVVRFGTILDEELQ